MGVKRVSNLALRRSDCLRTKLHEKDSQGANREALDSWRLQHKTPPHLFYIQNKLRIVDSDLRNFAGKDSAGTQIKFCTLNLCPTQIADEVCRRTVVSARVCGRTANRSLFPVKVWGLMQS